MVFICVFRVFLLHLWVFLSKNPPPPLPPPKKKWSNCCLLRVRKDWKFLENMQKWLAM